MNITFDDLFAYRFQCQDITNDEILIIRKLKYYLYDNGFLFEDIDEYIFQFYIAFGHPITLDEIKLVEIDQTQDEDEDEDEDVDVEEEPNLNMTQILYTYSFLNNILSSENTPIEQTEGEHIEPTSVNNSIPIDTTNMIFNLPIHSNIIETFLNILNTHNINEDIVVTTDDISNINKIELDDTVQDKCSICMSKLEKGDIILDIECKHKFHKECLTEYLEKYNHICPICRQDIGKSKINY